MLCVCVHTCAVCLSVPWSACGGPRITLRAGSFLWSTFLWVSGIKLRSLGLHWKQFACLPISAGLHSRDSPCFPSNSNSKVFLLLNLRWEHCISLSVKADGDSAVVYRGFQMLAYWCFDISQQQIVEMLRGVVCWWSSSHWDYSQRHADGGALFLLSFKVLAMKWALLHPIVLAKNVLLHHELKISEVTQWNETS